MGERIRKIFEEKHPIPKEIYFNVDCEEYLPRVIGDLFCDMADSFSELYRRRI